jgi:hypothetical protein
MKSQITTISTWVAALRQVDDNLKGDMKFAARRWVRVLMKVV